jgi:hypothetical protein
MTNIKCFKCGKSKPEEDYKKYYKSGMTATYNVCLECRKAWVDTTFKLNNKAEAK